MNTTAALQAESRTADVPAPMEAPEVSLGRAILLAAVAAGAFHLAYAFPPLSFLIVVYLYGLVQLSSLPTGRRAFYFGLAVGYAVYAPHLTFFWTIFGWPAIALWTVLAFWLGLFVALARQCRSKFGRLSVLLIPFLWTGLEYFRGELYYLRFSWLSVGYAFSESPQLLTATRLGMYEIGLASMALAVLLSLLSKGRALVLPAACLAALACFLNLPIRSAISRKLPAVRVAGVQLEFPAPFEVTAALDKLLDRYPETDLFVLSEYTFDGPIPDRVKSWCRQHQKYLVVGGKDSVSSDEFYNTAFVIGPDGEIVFKQVKSVPIQFFKDGLPAREQKLWESPWGKLGICVCYDLSYRQVTDELVRQGAGAILAPTMDVADWGGYQHRLHGRVAPIRAAEYGVPIFRVCSSGISQLIDHTGRFKASAPFPGQGEIIAGELELSARGHVPFDRWLAPLSVLVTAVTIFWLALKRILERFSRV